MNELHTRPSFLSKRGFAGSFHDLSFGLNCRAHPNFLLRPEVRWDWYDGLLNAAPGFPLPFDDHNARNQFTAAMDLIATF